MTAITRWFIGLFGKEIQFLSRYKKSHPHFFWFIGLDALVSIALIVVLFQVINSNASNNTQFHNSGIYAMSSRELLDHLRTGHEATYWIGAVQGNAYTEFHDRQDVGLVYYWSMNSKATITLEPAIAIKTYDNFAVYAANNHPLVDPKDILTVVVGDKQAKLDTKLMNSETIFFTDRPQIVEISFAARQTKPAMVDYAARVRRAN